MQQHHLNVRNLQGLRDKYLWREAIQLNQTGEMCAELWSLNDTNDNKQKQRLQSHLIKSTCLTKQMIKYETKPQFITGSVNKGENVTSADAFLWNKLNLKHD